MRMTNQGMQPHTESRDVCPAVQVAGAFQTQPGQPSTFPFQLMVPPGLPNSMPGQVTYHLRGSADIDGVGAVVTLERGALRRTQFVKSGAGYLSSFDSRLLFSLPATDNESGAARITVRWPGGETESFDHLTLNQSNRIVQGDGTKIED